MKNPNKLEVESNEPMGWKETRLLSQNTDLEKTAEKRASRHKYREFLFPIEDHFKAEDIIKIYDMQGGECVRCYVEFTKEPYEIDHKVSLKMGGNNSANNIQLLCKSCNVSKKDKDYHEWISKVRHNQVINYLHELAEEGYCD